MGISQRRRIVLQTTSAVLILILALPLYAFLVSAHGAEEETTEGINLAGVSLKALYAAGLLSLAALAYSLLKRQALPEMHKRMVFFIILVSIALATLFLIGTTIYLNFTSVTGGPVHWHADYEIIVCGEREQLIDPESLLLNRVGTSTLHEHNDDRMHIEGTPRTLESVNLGAFFGVTDGHMESGWLHFHTNEGEVNVKNGDLCNGKPASLMMFVEKQEGRDRFWKVSTEFGRYVPSPYATIPPGDRVKIIFSERPPEEILEELHGR